LTTVSFSFNLSNNVWFWRSISGILSSFIFYKFFVANSLFILTKWFIILFFFWTLFCFSNDLNNWSNIRFWSSISYIFHWFIFCQHLNKKLAENEPVKNVRYAAPKSNVAPVV
jgi:hypothetical protein